MNYRLYVYVPGIYSCKLAKDYTPSGSYDCIDTDQAYQLARRLDDWAQDFDIYAYSDAVDDCAANVNEITQKICEKHVEGIMSYLREAIEDGDEENKIIIRAKTLLEELEACCA